LNLQRAKRSREACVTIATHMAWDWIAKGAKKVQELGAEYKQHAATVEHLLTLESEPATQEFAHAWSAMDERTRSSFTMTVASLALAHQGAGKTPVAATRAARLKQLQALIDANRSMPPAGGSQRVDEAAFTSSAARVTQRMADFAERAKPRAAEAFATARQGLERHGPAIGAAATVVLTELLKAKLNANTAAATSSAAPGTPAPSTVPPSSSTSRSPANSDTGTDAPSVPPIPGAAPIACLWEGTISGPEGDEQVCYRIMPSGRPAFGYSERGHGARLEELTHEGQQIAFVPPSGGVIRVTVLQVMGGQTESGFVIRTSYEQTDSYGMMRQEYFVLTATFTLRGSLLETRTVQTGSSYLSTRDGSMGGPRSVESSGMLRRTMS
jgi:hypothetical protein